MLQTKVLQNYLSYKILTGCTSLSPPGMELWGSKDLAFFKYFIVLECGSKSTKPRWDLPFIELRPVTSDTYFVL